MKENSLQPHKAEKVPKPSLDALREVNSDQMNVQATPESTTGTGCSPEHEAQLGYLNPQFVFWRESIKLIYFFLKNWAFCKLSLNLAGVTATASLLSTSVLRNESLGRWAMLP